MSYVDNLPDSAFLLVMPGGRKDAEGKTLPRNLRRFPVRDAAGKVDPAAVKAAVKAIPSASMMTGAQRQAATEMATQMAGPAVMAGRSTERMPSEVMGLQTRTFEVVELRIGGDGRTVHGRAVPYDQTIEISGGRERFVAGAFTAQIANGGHGRVKLFASHQGSLSGDVTEPVGKTVTLEQRADGLHGAWAMYETPKGDAALYMVKTGEVTGLSVGFKANDGGTRKGADGVFERHAATLDHVALTNQPAYAGAQVTAVRSKMSAGSYRRDLELRQAILARVLSDS